MWPKWHNFAKFGHTNLNGLSPSIHPIPLFLFIFNFVLLTSLLSIDNANNLIFWCHLLNKLEPWHIAYIM